MNSKIIHRINKDLGISLSRIEATVGLLEGGGTIPFIARYRKEATGNLDEVQIRDISDRHVYYGEVDERRQVVLATIEEQGKLTDELREKIEGCFAKNELEDLYLPYKPKRKTKAAIAREKGLEPLADHMQDQSTTEPIEALASRFVSEEKGVSTPEGAIEGALHIVAERFAENAELRGWLREFMLAEGKVRAKVSKNREKEKTKYSMYYDFEESVARIPSHRMLAIRRGVREKVLTHSVQIEHERATKKLKSRAIPDTDNPLAPLVEKALQDGYERLMEPSIQNEVRSSLRVRAENEAIRVFEENLRALLLAPPAGPIEVLGIDPGLRTGSKVAILDQTGKFLEHDTIYLTEPKKDLEAAEKTVVDVIKKHNVRGIVIGNGTGSRETETFVRSIVEKHELGVFTVVGNEAGASVYSASRRARQEFPKLDITIRGAISIARRLQDPLAELVKIDPKSIGVGQYQHDVDQKKLKVSLGASVESCVNRVGVDLNTASVDLLRYISGISERLAQAIVRYRDEHGPFTSREQLTNVSGMGEKSFEQSAGFLRIKDGTNVLDRTSVHPESYPIVERMSQSLGVSVADVIENPSRVNSIDFGSFEKEVGRYTLTDIRNEMLKPARDPRKTFKAPQFRDDVREITDLKKGMEIEGTVTNVTNFGAFVDLGVHQDGLIHISELSHRYIRDAREAVTVGDVVKVQVIGADPSLKRISLSMKATLPKPRPKPRPKPKPKPKPTAQPKPTPRGKDREVARSPRTTERAVPIQKRPAKARPREVSMEEKIRLLQEKFHTPDK